MCRYMTRGIKEPCCINFGVMSEIVDKLPRFIPEKEKYHLSRAEAVARFTEHNGRGYIGTIWYGPYPYINNLCSCENPECAGIRPRVDFGINSIYKAEYVIGLDAGPVHGLHEAARRCARSRRCRYDATQEKVAVKRDACCGCGVCRHACATGRARLAPREETADQKGKY